MNSEELEMWKDGVFEHCHYLETLVNDRKTLKGLIEEHLKQFFDWDEIEYSKDFDVITMKWAHDAQPVIYNTKIGELGMDWIIKAEYDDLAYRIVVIEIYPFGLPVEDVGD